MFKTVCKIRRTRRTPLYNVGTASRLTGIPVWTLRWIEKQGLISPQRTGGNQRLFSDEDLDLLLRVRQLMEEQVNVAGIRIILRLQIRRAAFIYSGGEAQNRLPSDSATEREDSFDLKHTPGRRRRARRRVGIFTRHRAKGRTPYARRGQE